MAELNSEKIGKIVLAVFEKENNLDLKPLSFMVPYSGGNILAFARQDVRMVCLLAGCRS